MEHLHNEVAKELKKRSAELQKKIVERQLDIQPELNQRYSESDMEYMRKDTAYNLRFLIEALTLNSKTLFVDYTKWLKITLLSYNLPQKDILNHYLCIKNIMFEELPLEMGTIVSEFVDEAIKELENQSTFIESFVNDKVLYGDYAKNYLNSVLSGDKKQAEEVVSKAKTDGISISDIYLKIFEPAQRELGRLWQLNKISVAQEHYATGVTQTLMSKFYEELFSTPKFGGKMVSACIGGEQHEVALRMLTDLFEYSGWDTFYLGANMPNRDIAGYVAESKPELLAISVTMTFNLNKVTELISLVKNSIGNETKIFVGGYPFTIEQDLWKKVGADFFAYSISDAINKPKEYYLGS